MKRDAVWGLKSSQRNVEEFAGMGRDDMSEAGRSVRFDTSIFVSVDLVGSSNIEM